MSLQKPQILTILGSTGSIGVSTLDVISRHPSRFTVFALCAHTQVDKLFAQCCQFSPSFAVLADEIHAEKLRVLLKNAGIKTKVLSGKEALIDMASAEEVTTIMAAIVGSAGLAPTLAAVKKGKKILLANKESLVMAGAIFMAEVSKNKAVLLPIDSEHNAIFQSLPHDYSGNSRQKGVAKILLTASGGPFRKTPLEKLQNVTPEEACAHPKWKMGRKISVDSATMMNKGLEMIEARWLFNLTPAQIEVVVHPESIIHSLVQYIDGSVLAQLGNPDMRTPIAHALAYPERIESGVLPLNLFEIGKLHFEKPDVVRFPALRLAAEAISAGGTMSAVLNAANEIAVEAFLSHQISFLAISQIVEKTMNALPNLEVRNIEMLIEEDQKARQVTQQFIDQF